MTETRPARPPSLLVTCLYLGGVFVVQLITALVLVGDLSTAEGQQRVDRQIGWFEGGGTSFAEAQSIYQAILTVLAVLAGMGVVFAVYAARGHHVSRVMLTVLAVVMLVAAVAGLLGDGFFVVTLGIVGVVFAAQLWTVVVRSWFRQLAGKPPLALPATPAKPVAPVPAAVTPHPVVPPPPPPSAFGPGHPGVPFGGPTTEPLPRSVSIATWTTLIGSIVAAGLAAMFLLSTLVIGDYDKAIAQGGAVADLVRGSEDEFNDAIRLLRVVCGITIALSAGGVVAAVRVLRTRRSGDVMLFVMAAVTVIFALAIAPSFPFGLPWGAAAIVVIFQLRTPEARAWFART